ncbi:hypothetical protein TIFTF001_009237 [Ficus carica]|uniref:Uncharacterized protein n=1 Tax=Ficus carica TaxID=3494 RepID=A0AA88A6F2_FICCA|nr:hypothetical protein TIFTF001_009237 [Ficus carica]
MFRSYISTVKIVPGGDCGDDDQDHICGCVIEWSFTVDPVEGGALDDLVTKYELQNNTSNSGEKDEEEKKKKEEEEGDAYAYKLGLSNKHLFEFSGVTTWALGFHVTLVGENVSGADQSSVGFGYRSRPKLQNRTSPSKQGFGLVTPPGTISADVSPTNREVLGGRFRSHPVCGFFIHP